MSSAERAKGTKKVLKVLTNKNHSEKSKAETIENRTFAKLVKRQKST